MKICHIRGQGRVSDGTCRTCKSHVPMFLQEVPIRARKAIGSIRTTHGSTGRAFQTSTPSVVIGPHCIIITVDFRVQDCDKLFKASCQRLSVMATSFWDSKPSHTSSIAQIYYGWTPTPIFPTTKTKIHAW